jgi:hypothetical protein
MGQSRVPRDWPIKALNMSTSLRNRGLSRPKKSPAISAPAPLRSILFQLLNTTLAITKPSRSSTLASRPCNPASSSCRAASLRSSIAALPQ